MHTLTQGQFQQQHAYALAQYNQYQQQFQQPQAPLPAVGRGVGTTLPAWIGQQIPAPVSSTVIPGPPPLPPRPSDDDGSQYAT